MKGAGITMFSGKEEVVLFSPTEGKLTCKGHSAENAKIADVINNSEIFARAKKLERHTSRYEKIAHHFGEQDHGLEKHKTNEFGRCTSDATLCA
jgi:predicted lipid-binding transport protein (Tim44 family)